MIDDATRILESLRTVESERARRAADRALDASVQAVKRFQHARFAHTYDDLLGQPRLAPATRFFLDELYGPRDFSERDRQFARIVPALVRLFPSEIVQTVRVLSELHALSELLDTRMGVTIGALVLDGAAYGRAWRAVGEPPRREQQIELMLAVGRALERYTRNPWLRRMLRLMRGPAEAAGLGALQRFLESGFVTFGGLRDARWFLDLVAERERAMAARLFDGGDAPDLAVAPGRATASTSCTASSGEPP